QAEDGIRDKLVTGVQTCALPICAWDAIREIFATAALSRQRGYTASKFSFNSGDGRCPTCGGSGFEHVEMQFLSDVYLRCPDCDRSEERRVGKEWRCRRPTGSAEK